MNKNVDEIGIKYYITTFFYMIFYVILRIYAALYLLLFVYSSVVFLLNPNTYVENDFYKEIVNGNQIYNQDSDDSNIYRGSYFFKRSINDDEATGLWKEKRLYVLIYCAINLLLVIFGFGLSGLHKIINSYLSLKFINENNNNNNINEIKKKETIKVGNKNYDVEIYPFQNLFLSDNEANKIYEFRKIKYKEEL